MSQQFPISRPWRLSDEAKGNLAITITAFVVVAASTLVFLLL